jgi:hypothetical protein
LSRLNGSLAPDRLVTLRLAVSTVVNRRPHSGHCRRRRIEVPSSEARLSTTRLSPCRQKGQCTGPPRARSVDGAVHAAVHDPPFPGHNLWKSHVDNYTGVIHKM